MRRVRLLCWAGTLLVSAGGTGALAATEVEPGVAAAREGAPEVVQSVETLLGERKLAEAGLKVRELMLAHPDDPAVQAHLHWLLGRIWLRAGRSEKAATAAASIEDLRRRHPGHVRLPDDCATELRVHGLMGERRFAEARAILEPLLARPESDPGFLEAVRHIATCYVAEGSVAQAAEFLSHTLSRARSEDAQGQCLWLLAEVKLGAGDKEAGVELLERVARAHPTLRSRVAARLRVVSGTASASDPTPDVQAPGCGSATGGCGSSKPAPEQHGCGPASGGCGSSKPPTQQESSASGCGGCGSSKPAAERQGCGSGSGGCGSSKPAASKQPSASGGCGGCSAPSK